MIKRIARLLLIKLGILPPADSLSCWEKYRDYIRIHPTAIIDPTAAVKIFNPPNPPKICLEIGEGSHIFSTFALLRPEARIKVGKRSQLGNSVFISADSIDIGDDVLMAWGITVMDNDSHSLAWERRKNDVRQCHEDYQEDCENLIKHKNWSNVAMYPIKLGNRTWIGFNASILKGVTIGDESVVGAGSIVIKDVPPNSVVAGNPAKIVKYLNTSDNI